MSYRDCISDQLKKEKISKRKAQEALERYDNIHTALVAKGMPPADAALQAGTDALTRAVVESREAAKRKVANALAAFRIEQEMVTYKGSPGRVANAMMDADPSVPVQSYATLKDVVRGQLHSVIRDLIEKYSPKFAGIVHPTKGLDDLLQEMFALVGKGKSTNSADAKAFAKAVQDTQGLSVDLWNMAGGTLLKREDFVIPQHQSRWRMAKAGEKDWIDAHMGWLDWGQMRRSDGTPMPPTDAERRKILADVYATMKTDGLNTLDTRAPGRGSLGNTFDESRFLIYKDADSWKAMHETFGEGSVYDVIITHLEDRAHRIAMLKRFGPNPEMMRDIVSATALKIAGQRDAKETGSMSKFATSKVEKELGHFNDMFDVASRKTKMASESTPGHIMSGVRQLLTSAYLGSATLAAIPGDFFTATHARYFDGMPQTTGIRWYLEMLTPGGIGKDARDIAAQAGFVNESAVAMNYGAERFSPMQTYGPAWTRRVSDVVLRASLLTPHTQSARLATELETLGMLARDKGKTFADLPYRAMLERAGIDAADWDAFRAIPTWKPRDGVEFLRPGDVFAHVTDKKLAMQLHDKFMVMAVDQSKTMVLDASLHGAVALRGNSRPGTLPGEILNSFAMFKNFPMTFLHIFGRRGMLEQSAVGKLSYYAALGLGMTAAGAMAVQLRNLAQGRDPVDMSLPAFWGQAALTGGALGIWGDFLFSGVNRFGHGPADTAAGPVFTAAKEWGDLTIGNLSQWMQGKETNVLPEAVQVARRALPGTSLWYARLALQRTIFDQLQREVDPRAHARWQRDEQSRMRDYGGQRYWWRPGQMTPDRGPQFQ